MRSKLPFVLASLFGFQVLPAQVIAAETGGTTQSSFVSDSLIVHSGEALELQPHDYSAPQSMIKPQSSSGDEGVEVATLSNASSSSRPRSVVFLDNSGTRGLFASDSTQADSLPPPAKPKLLPDNMSFMERWLWGESGVVRGIGIASPLTPEVRKHELAVRRTMLSMHQVGGFVTLASMLGAVYYGQRYLDHSQRNDLNMHQTFVLTTLLSYGSTAMLSVLSPPPLIRREGETSSTTIHKTLAWVHFAGMIVTPLLASAINKRGSSYYEQARVHQISAYITTAVFTASMIIVTF